LFETDFCFSYTLKRKFYGEIKLWSGMEGGMPDGASHPAILAPGVVCLKCGHSEFKIDMTKAPATLR
jgi:hypothetical protein